MRPFITAVTALTLSSCASPSRPVDGAGTALSGAETSLIRFADRFDRAQLARDGPTLTRMVADDLVFIDGSGTRLSKREFIEGWTAAGVTFDPITLVDRVVVPLGDDAGIVTAETVLQGSSNGKRFSSRIRFSDTFKRVNGNWQAVHIQVTRLAPED